MYERILVPLDGSDVAEEALLHAREIARHFGSRLYLLHVVEPLLVPSLPSFAGPELSAREHPGDAEAASNYLQGWVRTLGGEGLAAAGLLRHGSPADEILDCQEEFGISLIVIATEDRLGLGIFGGERTSDAVLARTKAPVLVVPVGWKSDEGARA